MADLDKKIRFAIKLLQNIPQDGPIEVSYSGGKDSDVILQLTKEAGIPFEAIYKNTTIDPPGTIHHAKEMGATIIRPKQTFAQIIEDKGFPNRWRRFCCGVLKEYKIHDRAIQGIRRCESNKRAEMYKEPEMCRLYPHGEKVRVYYPILEWTDQDVETFIKDRGIKVAPVYYDEEGNFHVERRLGCIGCPLANLHTRMEQFKKWPGILKLYLRSGDRWLKNKPHTKTASKFNNVWELAYFYIMLEGKVRDFDDFRIETSGGMFPEMALDCESILRKEFNIEDSFNF